MHKCYSSYENCHIYCLDDVETVVKKANGLLLYSCQVCNAIYFLNTFEVDFHATADVKNID